jgi:uncharacterized protein
MVTDRDSSNTDLVFNVAQLLKEHVGATRRLHLQTDRLPLYGEEGAGPGGQLYARHVHGDVKATRIRDGLLVQGPVDATVTLECSRCLEQFDMPVHADLEEQFQPTIDVETGMPVQRAEHEENDQAFKIDANHQMDLTEPVRQALIVELPMKPLCREDCAGICPVCGASRNEVQCGHEVQAEDARWSGLRRLRLEDFPAGDLATAEDGHGPQPEP